MEAMKINYKKIPYPALQFKESSSQIYFWKGKEIDVCLNLGTWADFFLSFNYTLCASSGEKETWDLGTIWSLYAGGHGVKLASKLLYFSDLSSKIFKSGSCRNFEIGLY